MRPLNEHYYPANESDIRFNALQMLRATQASLTEINFLEVISIMKPENPLKKDVLKFEEDLNDLTNRIGAFIQTAKNDVEYQPSDEEKAAAAAEEEEDDIDPDNEDNPDEDEKKEAPKKNDKKDAGDEEEEKDKAKKKEKPVKEMVIDSSISRV